MSQGLLNFIEGHRQSVEDALAESLPLSFHMNAGRLNEALHYAVFPGGKRMRPMLTIIAARAAGSSTQRALPAACAIEFLHTSSLILDDLPGMDDAAMRRGRAALHLAFSEGIAMLAALALLNQSYALLARAASGGGAYDAMGRVITEATRCVGADGMIGGQAADIDTPTAGNSRDALTTRNLKTTALMRLTMTAGAIAASASQSEVAALAQFGECIGIAYQIYDDLLDELGSSEETGKPAGQDARHLRPSFVTELGVEGANSMAASLVGQAKAAVVGKFGDNEETRLLADAADFIARGTGQYRPVTNLVV
ncbi:MAG TPA: polyprenyl synthetase family protein [Blastocatellia bacterium]|jgi:geranylgeranyl diphosphate synthase type II|nr:polyprenyl synthetase family protein [Blastocatellia bacterium]